MAVSATLRGVTARIAAVDLACGFVLCALTAAAAGKLARLLNVN
jgi:hypothetical protein